MCLPSRKKHLLKHLRWVRFMQRLAPVIPIIKNPHALEVHKAWARSPGQLLLSIDAHCPNGQPDSAGFLKLVGAIGPGMRSSNTSSVAEAEEWCEAATCEGFTVNNQRTPQLLLFKDEMGGSTNNYTDNIVNPH